MKKKNNSPYRDLSLEKTEAPARGAKNPPKAQAIRGKGDLRSGGKR